MQCVWASLARLRRKLTGMPFTTAQTSHYSQRGVAPWATEVASTRLWTRTQQHASRNTRGHHTQQRAAAFRCGARSQATESVSGN